MKRTIERIMRRYGAQVTLHFADGAEQTVRAFLRPVTSKSLQNMRRDFDELGQIPGGQYLFIGPADCSLAQADWVGCGGVRYLPRRAETLLLGDEVCYIWGLLTGGGEEDGGTA